MEASKMKVLNTKQSLNAMELIAHRSIALHLDSLNIKLTHESMDMMFELMEIYLDNVLSDLQKITHTQRRVKACAKDLKLLLKDYHVDTSDLAKELVKSHKTEIRYKDDEDDTSIFFHDVIRLAPPTVQRSEALLPWLPELPPDHTYRRSAKYTERITDQKLVRLKVVEEGKLGERALDGLMKYHLHSDGVDEERQEEKEDIGIEEIDNQDKEKEEDKEHYDIFTPAKHDIEKYVQARLKYLAKRKVKPVNPETELIGIVSSLSPYTQAYDKDKSGIYLEKHFKKTISTLKTLKKEKEARRERMKVIQQQADKKREEIEEDDFNFDNFEEFEKFGDSDVELLDAEHFNGVEDKEGDTVML